MKTKMFDHIDTFREILRSQNINFWETPCGRDVFFETEMISLGNFISSFIIFIGNNGAMQISCYLSGAVPSECRAELRETVLKEIPSVQSIKVYTDEDGFLAMTYDAFLPSDKKFMEAELENALGLMNIAYTKMLPPIMLEYWQGVESNG